MAVHIQVQLEVKPIILDLEFNQNKCSSDFKNSKKSMSSRSPPPASGMDSSILFPCFHNSLDLAKPLSPTTSKMNSPTAEKKSWSSIKTTKINKSPSTSTHVATYSTDTSSLILSTEKKRNKLGYHRTSVACGEQST